VEIAAAELQAADAGLTAAVGRAVREAGYATVEIDPAGYRRGRLNQTFRVRG